MSIANFYTELDLDQSSSAEDLKVALRKQRRRYRQLAGALSQEQRSLGESKMALISQAEKAFASEESKAAYDQELRNATPVTPSQGEASAPGLDPLQQAQSAFSKGRYRLARSAATEATRIQPNNGDAWRLRAEAALELGDLDDAELAAETSRELRPGSAAESVLLSQIHLRQRDFATADSDLREAEALVPDNMYVQMLRAEVRKEAGQLQDAAHFLASAADRLDASNPDHYITAAEWMDDANNHGAAAALFAKAASLDSSNSYSAARHAWALSDSGNASQARELATQTADRFQDEFSARALIGIELDNARSHLLFDTQHGHCVISDKDQLDLATSFLERVNPYLTKTDAQDIHRAVADIQAAVNVAKKRNFRAPGCLFIIGMLILLGISSALIGDNILWTILGLALLAFTLWWAFETVFERGYKRTKRAYGR